MKNIAFNNPEMEMNQVIRAAQAAAIHEDIEKMPMGRNIAFRGWQCVFGRSTSTSGPGPCPGPSSRDPLTHEATSALDVATERAVEQNINTLSSDPGRHCPSPEHDPQRGSDPGIRSRADSRTRLPPPAPTQEWLLCPPDQNASGKRRNRSSVIPCKNATRTDRSL